MQILIKNIWNIKEANVNLEWLSVIAWNNDTWKSTVNKIVFSVVKSLQRYKIDFSITKEELLEEKINELYRYLRFIILRESDTDNSSNDIKLNNILKKDFYPPVFLNELNAFSWSDIFTSKKDLIKNIWLNNDNQEILLSKIDDIKKEFLKEEKREDLIKMALEDVLKSEFENQLNNELLWKKWIIELKDGNIILFKIILENNKVSDVKINDDILKIKDTTFIDSPITLNLFNYLINNITSIPWRRSRELQFHIKDLFTKIRESKFDEAKNNNFLDNIKNIVKGVFKIIKKWPREELVFEKDWQVIETINTATWIKSFWILSLLDKSNCLEFDNLLILDEPESHLHPEWQVKYAELIINLIKERDLSVLITSHSPYLIEALDKYSRETKLKASFYLAEVSNDGWYIIENMTENKNAIFEKLSEPFEKLVWN